MEIDFEIMVSTVPESRAELNALYFAALERLTVEDWRRASQ
jgi:hypothetical protein